MCYVNKIYVFIILFFLIASISIGQTVFYNAEQFPLIGKISEETETRYERLPAYLRDKSREPVWALGKNTAGLAIRFRSNSTSISAKWDVLNNRSMQHMTNLGIKGLDLYAWENNQWRFVNSARPKGKKNEATIIESMESVEREYMLFLPLYDGVTSLFIGIDSCKTIGQPVLKYPDTTNPIIVYGTSITQGCSASRPGMAYTNMLMRWFNREVINLGFSGNGRLDYEIAELIGSKKNASLIILDNAPNGSPSSIGERTFPFVEIIRKHKPQTPIIIVENMEYADIKFNTKKRDFWQRKNNSVHSQYLELIKQGYKDIYYLDHENLIGDDGEGTVDGTHFTDLGFYRFANALVEKIKTIKQ